MKKNLVKFIKLNILTLAIVPMIFSANVYANSSIKIVDGNKAKNEIVLNDNGKMVLKQEWNGMKFELSKSTKIGTKKLKEVDSEEYEKAIENVNFDLNLVGDYKVYFLKNRIKLLECNGIKF
jgi:hypothetical protein